MAHQSHQQSVERTTSKKHGVALHIITGALAISAGYLSSCSLVTDSSVAGGIGDKCSSDSECQGSSCNNGICTISCKLDSDCPLPSKCVKASSTCENTLKVAGVWMGSVTGVEGWAVVHHKGILAAQEKLGYIDYNSVDNAFEPEEKVPYLADVWGADVLILNSLDPPVQNKLAREHPKTKFIQTMNREPSEPNVVAVYGHTEYPWYVSGRVAARTAIESGSNHLGFIGSYISAEIIQLINAFALGARREKSDMVVEVRWMGFFNDRSVAKEWEYVPKHRGPSAQKETMQAEEYLTAKLIDSGAVVIAHALNNELPCRYVHFAKDKGELKRLVGGDTYQSYDVWTIAIDNPTGYTDATGLLYKNTLGAVYWDWEPAYSHIFDIIHRHLFKSESFVHPFSATPPSIVGFNLSPENVHTSASVLQVLLYDAADKSSIFKGPIPHTGQRKEDLPEGVDLTMHAQRSMCWFVEGVVERENPNDVGSNLVPALVPGSDHVGVQGAKTIAARASQPPRAPEVLVSLIPNDTDLVFWNCEINAAAALSN